MVWVIVLSALGSSMLTVPLFIILSDTVETRALIEGALVGALFGVPSALVALVFVVPVSMLVWRLGRTQLARFGLSLRFLGAIVAPLAILLANGLLIAALIIGFGESLRDPMAFSRVVMLGTPTAVVLSPLMALWLFSPVEAGA